MPEPEDDKDQISFPAYFSRTLDTLFKTSSHLLLITELVTTPDEFRDFVWMLEPPHIDQNFIRTISDWLEGSGWTKIN